MADNTESGASGRHGKRAAIDLEAMTIEDIRTLIANATAKLEEKQEEAKVALLAEFREKAARIGVTVESLLPSGTPSGRSKRVSGGKLPVKYRSPDGKEWSGRGRLPTWLQEAEKMGRKRDEFAVAKSGE